MKSIYDLQYSEIENFIIESDESAYRAKQVWEGLYQHFYASWNKFSSLPLSLRDLLEINFSLSSIEKINSVFSEDGQTEKFLFQLNDQFLIESVLLRKDNRLTLCISTQSGCPVGCVFCATGNFGFHRNLTSGEIIEQVVFVMRILHQADERLTNIVLMGMGEPFLNYSNTLSSVIRMNDPNGFNFGARRITISTIGIIEGIESFANENLQINLSVSLHAPNDDLRRQLVPMSKNYSINQLIGVCHTYFIRTKRRITFEYVMINRLNDTPELAFELADILKGLNCHVNLIPLNKNSHYKGEPSSSKVMREFGRILISKSIATSIRDSQGSDINAGCGQLAGNHFSH